jgi:glyoxylase-like metal-dependent hydrolase (beta-lactamase superfamily II)
MRSFIAVLIFCCQSSVALCQAPEYPADLLDQLRRNAASLPGELPIEVRLAVLNPAPVPLSTFIEGAPDDSVTAGYTVFQIRYSDHWIAVDAALDRSYLPNSTSFSTGTYDSIQILLRDARLVLLTHEHHDHVAGLLSSPYFNQIKQHTLLTPAQVATLRDRPNRARIRIDSATAAAFRTVDYELLKAVAPGVVILTAPGHTPGSQILYVALQNGEEMILAGDVAWHMDGVRTGRQKPVATSNTLREDRPAIAAQLAWLKSAVDQGVPVLLSHDVVALNQLVARGIVAQGFVLR